ncbi:amidohydrolase family protein [Gracilibacillus lacisalsi]|uniref:amidohydrolase family protein n=1 Tax=Gracilibacillus lacisalsi TaxID=393087 RepID=UPI000371175C|nr:amidohydrolase family protein [Gracilibacillus lacisalsi]
MYDITVKNVKLLEGEMRVHIGINNGKFVSITDQEIAGHTEWDGKGNYLLPPFVETHTHMDTVLTAGFPRYNQSGTLFEAIDIWQSRKDDLTVDDVVKRASKAIKLLISYGVLFIRAAVDISDPNLTALKALLEVRKQFKGKVELQIIAFPQSGLVSCVENIVRMRKAIELGADAVSAVPHLEHTREKGIESLVFCFQMAKEYDTFIHVFCDEVDDEHSRYLEVVANLVIDYDYHGKVTVSHVNALAYYSDVYANKVIQLVKQAGITVVACPLVNSAMQGRYDPHPKGRGITRVKQLEEAGVNVCIAHDDIRTPFYPLGVGNMLQAAHLGLHLAHMTGRADFYSVIDMITKNGATCFRASHQYGIEVGKPANFIILPVDNLEDMLSVQPKPIYVVRDGEMIAATEPSQTRYFEKIKT